MRPIWLGLGISIFIAFFVISEIGSGRELSMDPTRGTDGKDPRIVTIGSIKYHYRVELNITNMNSLCNITGGIGEDDFGDCVPFPQSEIFLRPGENGSCTWTNPTIGESETLDILIVAHFNYRGSTAQQQDVKVDYTIKVYNDLGVMVEDHTNDEVVQGDIIGPSSGACDSVILLSLALLFIVVCSIGILKKRKVY